MYQNGTTGDLCFSLCFSGMETGYLDNTVASFVFLEDVGLTEENDLQLLHRWY